ncbi:MULTISPECIES: FG-GAP-like repeat-containing protein [Streptomyces]|uniref:Esterase n=1 Tax=Streptomyces albus (strain ATCC 21838 / DSM 41398 / FERM P-419 / JCM 4703 / NBRC 107858) TaxID=1081613 RepID=A0A0B5EQJ9_STRA4|nr:FG-GAP-like repeat-containing protein [Streptomyces sp. SCSIO ZS0520]AJE85043.1 hypothetical protein SLNWT_4667 [Streptomyces albus]AOU79350.1 hypothetical protein SLNHY_4659 [Streptomyces albus]AYN35075.1 hypothetical protein DUI70_4578 [Streptomyces albus]
MLVPRHRLAARCAAVAALLTAPVVALSAPASADGGRAAEPAAVQADFDHDGLADVTASSPAGYQSVRYGGTDGRNQTVTVDPARSTARDLDEDGYADLVSGDTIRWGSAEGLTDEALTIPADQQFGGSGVTSGDFDGDGHADLVAQKKDAEEWGDLRVLYGPFTREGTASRSSDLSTGRTFDPTRMVSGDITGDGRDDLVTLHAFEEMSESSQFWAGGADGLATKSTTLPDAASAAIGDVDADGYGDLVIRTVPGGVVENLPYDAGTVKVLYGTAKGPSTSRTTTLTQNSAGVPGASEDGDQFGYDLAAADVNGDGYADVAAGVPYEDLTAKGRPVKDAGSVVLLRGSAKGLTGTGAQAVHQDTAGVPGAAESKDYFGSALWTGDTDGDGHPDLAVGAPGEDTSNADTGAVWLLRGSPAGLTSEGSTAFNPAEIGAPDADAQLGSDFAS